MPYTLKPNKMFVKNPDGTGYLPQNIITDRATSDTVADIEAAGQAAVDRVNAAVTEIDEAIDLVYDEETGKIYVTIDGVKKGNGVTLPSS